MSIREPKIREDKLFLDRPWPHPKLPPRNIHGGVKRDLPCSSPKCPNYCSIRCGFCKLHCIKFHSGVHYGRSNIGL